MESLEHGESGKTMEIGGGCDAEKERDWVSQGEKERKKEKE